VIAWGLLAPGSNRLAANAADTEPAAHAGAKEVVDFAGKVAPILRTSCGQCHLNGKSKGGLNFDTRAALMKGGDSGPSVVVGKADESLLIQLVEGKDEDRIMPAKGKRLTPDEIAILRNWVNDGAAWPENFSFDQTKQAKLEPRKVELPPVADGGSDNPIDRLLAPYFAKHSIEPAPVVDDRVFARRVYLDVIGLLPTPQELQSFLADAQPDKRQRLVRTLLDDGPRYAVHWLTFWNDALRNDYKGTGYVDGGRSQITSWLYNALASNMPYDQFVRELITGQNGAEGFSNGIVWRGVVNASQTPQMQAAQNISQVFMGVNLKCASCHDSFINHWKLDDAYGLAAVYADGPIEMARCDKPTGKMAKVKFLYPQLGEIDSDQPKEGRVKQLADVLTSEKNGRLTRTMVNRLWQKLLGRGLVEPADDMDAEPWNADVLDWLAADLSDNKYDLKKTLETILTSRAYQMAAVTLAEEPKDGFVFAGPLVRRMSAEQFADAISMLTGVWPEGAAVRSADEPAPEKPKKNAPQAVPPEAIQVARASLRMADPLQAALGRSNREQVVTERPKEATTLQALELTNGATLASMLHSGAKKMAASGAAPDMLIGDVYAKALGRAPTPDEMTIARSVLGTSGDVAGVEDILWVLVMLPEFQLIR
jgi:mono/diheme cytochrome c family protein